MIARIIRVYKRTFRSVLVTLFPFWQRLGVHVTPNYFYFPIPDTSVLKDDLWSKNSELAGINMNEQNQLTLLSRFVSQYKDEYETFPRTKTDVPHQYYVNNNGFESVDGEILYCMIRHFNPETIFEIGSGNTTCLSAQAILKNKEENKHECALIACEPYPNRVVSNGFAGLSELRQTAVQNIPLSEFQKLKENDILFIDSSHVLKIGSDVQYEYLEVLPRLNKGVLIHVHDIFLPAEYPKEWVIKRRYFWNEQYLLQAFLSFNDSFEVLWAGSYMHLKHPDKLEAAFSSYKRDTRLPGSFWMRKIK